MPVDKLPLMLEDLLNNILENNCVASWNIHGANNFSQVTVRFKVDTDENDIQQSATYRKVPPSRVTRDRNRASNFKSSVFDRNDNSSIGTEHISNKHSDVRVTSSKPSTAIAEINNTEINMQQEIMTSSTNTNPTSSKQDMAAGPKASPSVVLQTNSSNADKQTIQNLVEGREHFSSDRSEGSSEDIEIAHCGLCQADIKSYSYHKCTYCLDEIDICDACFKDNRHSIHKRYIQSFTFHPGCWEDPNMVICNSCGQVFPINDETMVWNCKICEDYCICEKCRLQRMHNVHKDNFKMIFIKAFIASL